MKRMLIFLIFGLLILGCTTPETPTPEPEERIAQFGDWVVVDYTLKLEDGSIVETTYGKSPMRFQLLTNAGLIDGFVEGVIGMKEGEMKTIVVPPEKGYGTNDPSKIVTVARAYNRSLFEYVPVDYLESQGVNVTIGHSYKTSIGYVLISNVTNGTAELFYVLSKDQEFIFNGIPQKVLAVENMTAEIQINVEVGKMYFTTDEVGNPMTVVVQNVTETAVVWDSNHPLADTTLYFDVMLRTIE